MSETDHPRTPDASSKTSTVSPGARDGENPVILDGFDPEVLDMIVDLLTPGTSATAALRNGVDTLFSTTWQVLSWSDLMVFTSADVTATITDGTVGNNIPKELKSIVVMKKLGYIVDFARIGQLTAETTMNDVVKSVVDSVNSPKATHSSPQSPSRRALQVFDKKAVPNIDKFSGKDEDYFTWRESTINILGTAGFGRFLDEGEMAVKHPEVAESVFYSLRGAVHGGQAQSTAQGMLDDKQLLPEKLWAKLEEYYNTALNRANVVLFDIRRLLNIRLDPQTTATKFISDFRDCLQRLRKNNARLSDDNDTLRALLLVAIQDDDFELVRDSIVHKPDSSVESILTELRERETSLMMKDQASNLSGDGTSNSRYSRRTQLSKPRGGGSKQQSGGNQSTGDRKWSIPRLPDTWKKSFGASLFKLLLDWRADAHKGKTQAQLNTDYDTVVEAYRPGQAGQNSGRRSRATTVSQSPTTTTTTDTDTSVYASVDNSNVAEEPQQRKRIRLQKSRRVVTERST